MTTSRRRDAWLLLTLVVCLHILGWRAASRFELATIGKRAQPSYAGAQSLAPRSGPRLDSLRTQSQRRSLHTHFVQDGPDDRNDGNDRDDDKSSCTTLPSDPDVDLCAYVKEHCPPSGHVDYLPLFYCSPKAARPFALAGIIAWMLLLFSWVGLVASDFFCPNLSTLASRLGLTESVAGVTFLAFGNGSPDVFSTFSAMKNNSGSLAVGELLGAASFIVSVVAGSMMLVQPFRVNRFPFVRDVGFFTVSIAFTLLFLADGKLMLWETASLVGLYVVYVVVIVVGTWWVRRMKRRKAMMAIVRDEYRTEALEPYRDDDSVAPSIAQEPTDAQHHQHLHFQSPRVEYLPEDEEDLFAIEFAEAEDPRPRLPSMSSSAFLAPPSPSASGSASPASLRSVPLSDRTNRLRRPSSAWPSGRPSLLSAVEFRDVVNSLRKEHSSARSLAAFNPSMASPAAYHPPLHHHHHHHHSHYLHARRHSHASAGPLLPSSSEESSPGALALSGDPMSSALRRWRSDGQHSQGQGGEVGQLVDFSTADVEDPWRYESGETRTPVTSSGRPTLPRLQIPYGGPTSDSSARGDGTDPLPVPGIATAPPKLYDDHSFRNERADMGATVEADDESERGDIPEIRISTNNAEEEGGGGNVETGRPRASERRKSAGPRWCGSLLSLSRRSAPSRRPLRKRLRRQAQHLVAALFPSLRNLREKSVIGIFLALVTAPAILALNLTLPVVDDQREAREAAEEEEKRLEEEEGEERYDGGSVRSGWNRRRRPSTRLGGGEDENENEDEGAQTQQPLIDVTPASPENDVEVGGGARARRRDEEIAAALHGLAVGDGQMLRPDASPSRPRRAGDNGDAAVEDDESTCSSSSSSGSSSDCGIGARRGWSPRLTAAQVFLAPLFLAWAFFSETDSFMFAIFVALVVGAPLAAFVLSLSAKRRYSNRTAQLGDLARCLFGFTMGMVWIMTIVDEVVGILQSLGLIFNLSDAILGLTIFAMGNSLGDFVANVTIAKLGYPVMAISACFGGPMLNILLGIGLSGSWVVTSQGYEWAEQGYYPIDFSPTLLVSGLGLLVVLVATLIFVPLNGYHLSRRWGAALLVAYLAVMTANVAVEVWGPRSL